MSLAKVSGFVKLHDFSLVFHVLIFRGAVSLCWYSISWFDFQRSCLIILLQYFMIWFSEELFNYADTVFVSKDFVKSRGYTTKEEAVQKLIGKCKKG